MTDQGLAAVQDQPPGEFLPGTQIEVVNSQIERGKIR